MREKKIVRGSNNKSISRAHHNKNNMRKRVPYTSPNGTVCDAMEIWIGTKTFTHYPSDTHTDTLEAIAPLFFTWTTECFEDMCPRVCECEWDCIAASVSEESFAEE